MYCNVARVRGQTYVSFRTLLFAVGSDISILRVPMAAAISPFYESTEPSQPVMSDDVSEERPQHRELHPLLFSNSVWVL